MNMKTKAEAICHRHMQKAKKLRLLREFILDCRLELTAQNENMHPEVAHNVGEALRVASDYVRRLEEVA